MGKSKSSNDKQILVNSIISECPSNRVNPPFIVPQTEELEIAQVLQAIE